MCICREWSIYPSRVDSELSQFLFDRHLDRFDAAIDAQFVEDV